MLICNWLLYISVWFLHWSFGTYSNTICPLTLRYWLNYRATMTMKSNIQSPFIHMTYLKEEWQNDSNKLHVCPNAHWEHLDIIFLFFWDGTASSGDRCLTFRNSRVASSSRVSWRWEHNISRFSLQNSYFRNWEQSLPNKTPVSKTVFCCLVITCKIKGLKLTLCQKVRKQGTWLAAIKQYWPLTFHEYIAQSIIFI